MYLVTFWKCYFSPPHNRKTTKISPQQQQKNQRSKARGFVGRSKSHRKSKSQRERDRFVALGRRLWFEDRFVARRLWVAGEVEGSWVEGSGLKIGSWLRRSVCRSAKSKAWSAKSKSKAVIGEVEVEGCDRRSRRSQSQRISLSLSLSISISVSIFARESGNDLKWKFSLQTISGSKPSKHPVNWK